MQVDVNVDAVLCGEPENRIDVPVEVALEADRVDTADKVGALGERVVEEFESARRGQQPLLREGDDLHVEQPLQALGGRPHAVHVRHALRRPDVDLRAQGACPVRDLGAEDGERALLDRSRVRRLCADVVVDEVPERLGARARDPGAAPRRFIRVDMRIDERCGDDDRLIGRLGHGRPNVLGVSGIADRVPKQFVR